MHQMIKRNQEIELWLLYISYYGSVIQFYFLYDICIFIDRRQLVLEPTL